jgi:AsmA-like C-terminal region
MAGDFSLQGMTYRAAGTPVVKINDLNASLSPQKLDLRNFDARLGKSDLRASGAIDNVLAYFSTNKTMTGRLTLNSAYFDANEWLEEPAAAETSKTPTDPAPTTTAAADEKVFDRWDFTVDGKVGKLKYDAYDISDLALAGHFAPNKMTVSNFGLNIGQSDLRGNGQILNAWKYLFDHQTVSGVISLRSTAFDLNQFMTPAAPAPPSKSNQPAPPPPPTGVIPVPKNIDMTLNVDMGKVQYTNITLSNLNGAVLVKDGVAKLVDCTAGLFGGQVGLNGEYNTKDESKPQFNIDLALLKMSFGNAFQSFETVKQFFPIAQMVDGTFNTTLSMSGLLGKDMMPDLNTISMAGFLETLDAILNNVKPLNAIGDKLNVSYLKRLELKNSKNWFEIKDGKVTVKPFNIQMREVGMQIGGSHGLNQEMSYQITTKTPRKALEKNAVGAAANAGLNWLSGEASKAGVSIAQGEFVNVRFDLTGSLFNPKIAVKVLGSDGESTLKEEASATAKAAVDKAKDSLATVANKELDKAKEKAKAAADKAADSLARTADKKVQEAKNKAVETVKEEAGKIIGKEVGTKLGDKAGEQIGDKAGEVLGDKGKKTVEDVKGKLDKWDPFKKKQPKKEGEN